MKRISIIAAVLVLVFSAQLLSQPEHPRALQKVIAKLNLTEEQKKDVEKIRVDMEKQAVSIRANLATARIDLRQLFKADTPDKSAVEKKLNEIADLSVQIRMNKINAWFAVNKLLTLEQQKTWKKVLENAPAFARQRMMNRMGGRQMPHHRNYQPAPH
jgi:Spy/CpxP family protein refolding chaperone